LNDFSQCLEYIKINFNQFSAKLRGLEKAVENFLYALLSDNVAWGSGERKNNRLGYKAINRTKGG